jgi:integrase
MGYVQKRTFADGRPPRFIGRVRVGGKEQSKSFDRQKDAKKWVVERENTNPTGRRSDTNTVGAELKHRIDQPETRKSTNESRKHVYANLGDLEFKRLADVTPEHIVAWKDTLMLGRPWADNKRLSSSTVTTMMAILSSVFNDAVARGQLPRNPVTFVRRSPSNAHTSVEPYQILSVEELRLMIRHGWGDYPLMVELGATSGLRAGEMAGLRIRSVDFSRRCVDVTEQADGHYQAYGWRELKTPHSRRTIPLPNSTLDLLLTHVEDSGREVHEPLFTSGRGGQWSSAHIANRWRETAKIAKVTGHSWHSVRHFYASALIHSGASVVTVQRRLGHASSAVTTAVYAHLWPGEDDRTRDVFDNLI